MSSNFANNDINTQIPKGFFIALIHVTSAIKLKVTFSNYISLQVNSTEKHPKYLVDKQMVLCLEGWYSPAFSFYMEYTWRDL